MITLTKVNKYFNRHKKNEIHVINNTSLDLPEKGLVALLGPSGCGKTTLLNVIGGLDKVKSGKIYINGKKITRKSTAYVDKIRNLNIGYIFQNYNLINNKSVYDNVAISLQMLGIKDKKEIKKRVNYVLETLGIYRYRNRYANMLSGGERQRVGIARAIVKNPNIIIADEPTGNLDSANSIEIMNIIKSISKNRLVLLVTHEKELAKFYADRILEIEDGKITKDYPNKNSENLDYRIENKIYLKDFKHHTNFKNEDNEINIYNNLKNDIKLTIVVKNNNIYIKGGKNNKIEIVDEDSNIEFINSHYQQIDKSIYEKYEFNFENIITKNIKEKYSSIISPVKMIIGGFKKILDYSFIKKLLLLGFLASGAFITYCISNIFGINNIDDKYFIEKNRYYYSVTMPKINQKRFLEIEQLASVDYVIPGDSSVAFGLTFPFYYQTNQAYAQVEGSIVSNRLVTKSDLVYGRLPENDYEIVVDKMVIKKSIDDYETKQIGIYKVQDFLNLKASVKKLNEFTIVGITDFNDPSIYVSDRMILDIISNSKEDDSFYNEEIDEETGILNYTLVDNLTLKKGRVPENDYEVIVNYENRYEYPLNKTIDKKVNGTKLKVVGYYEAQDTNFYVSANTIKLNLLATKKNLLIMPSDETQMINQLLSIGFDAKSTYEEDLNDYRNEKMDSMQAGLIASGVILLISFIEIYLMVRASFLSRIKEIGIYRAIGVKKKDIYKMFFGEIFAITTVACLPGALFVSYALNAFINSISYFEQNYLVNSTTIILSLIVIYIFNLIIGLLPVYKVLRQTPAQILARKDID